MKKPIIFAVDDDPQVLRAITRDLRQRYRSDYRILSTNSPKEALETLPELKSQGESIALFLKSSLYGCAICLFLSLHMGID